MNGYAMVAIVVITVSSCSAVVHYNNTEALKNTDPATECVRRALFQSDRIECIKAAKGEK